MAFAVLIVPKQPESVKGNGHSAIGITEKNDKKLAKYGILEYY